MADPAYWLPIIKPYSYGGPLTVEQVSCASMLGTPSLQTLVTARRADQALDVYVFTNITQPSPTLIFQLSGLVKGDAKISGYSTVLAAEVDQLSTINAGKLVSTMTADLFREFKWSASAGKMVQTVFPGIFPDLTRYQAEADQASVNQGHQPWKLSATQVATALAASLLNWPSTRSTKLGQASATGAVGMGQTTFSTTLYFQSTFPAGIQEGVLVLSAPSQANGSIAGEVMEKVLVNGALESPFAVLSVDLAVSPSSSTGTTCGSTVTFTYTATFHVQAGTAYAFPGVAQVNVTSPDVVQSNQVIPIGACTP